MCANTSHLQCVAILEQDFSLYLLDFFFQFPFGWVHCQKLLKCRLGRCVASTCHLQGDYVKSCVRPTTALTACRYKALSLLTHRLTDGAGEVGNIGLVLTLREVQCSKSSDMSFLAARHVDRSRCWPAWPILNMSLRADGDCKKKCRRQNVKEKSFCAGKSCYMPPDRCGGRIGYRRRFAIRIGL